VAFVRFLPLRNPRTTAPTPVGQVAMPSVLLVALQANGAARLFTPSGELALTFSAGHEQPVTQLAVSPLHDEYVVTTADASGTIRAHKVTVRQRRVPREQRFARYGPNSDKVSQYVGSQVNASAVFSRQMRLPAADSPAPLTALAMASQQGTKYFVAGDAAGRVAVFTRNGTLHAEMAVPGGARVESLHAQLNNLVFVAGGEWGFVDLERMEIRRMRCLKFQGRITAAIVDSQQAHRVLAADDRGTVWVFSMRGRRDCRIEHRFAEGATRAPLELASVRGFAVALEHAAAGRPRSAAVALNMSHVGKKKADPERAASAVVWRRTGPPVRSWATHKRYQQGDLVALLSEDGLEIEVLELLMQAYAAPMGDTFGNFKLPVFAVAIVLVLGYQYVKQQGAFDPGLVEA